MDAAVMGSATAAAGSCGAGQSQIYERVKRALDVVVAAGLLTLLSPIFAIVGLLIKVQDSGAVFYRAVRSGRSGTTFTMLKFRTMVPDAERRGGSSTPKDDVRITRVGHWLRRWKVDELPQLLNVLRGEMSLVGPRPQVPAAVQTYTEKERRLLEVRPGITDWASIQFSREGELLAGYSNPDLAYERLIRPGKSWLGLLYVDRRSFGTDAAILVATVAALMGRDPHVPPVPPDASTQIGLPQCPPAQLGAAARNRTTSQNVNPFKP